jgi:hypothetical protein
LKVVWNDKKVLRAVDREVDRVERRGAALVAATAKVLVPKDERQLVGEIVIKKSRYRDGGYMVYAQPPGTASDEFYAAYVEYGHAFPYVGRAGLAKARGVTQYSIREAGIVAKTVAPRPFMRPAVKKWRRIVRAMLKRAIT